MVAERWKIEAVLAFVRRVPFEQFYIAGANDTVSKTYTFMNLICCRPSYVYEVVRSLEVRDYCKGPLPDNKGRPHDLWVFGRYLEDYEVYIKFAVFVSGESVKAVCVSFHEAETPLFYPYRQVA